MLTKKTLIIFLIAFTILVGYSLCKDAFNIGINDAKKHREMKSKSSTEERLTKAK